MTAFPDFAAHGYQVIKELGHNLEGGRFTYLAKRLADNVDVVIKQFQFSKSAGWDGFRAIEREIQSLQGLNHRGIPKYLDKFETDSGYCLVTEYFPADTLAVRRSFTPDQIKQIAVQILEILVYLQERMPPVIHRDVKPENILVDDNLNVYLIDFGFARVGSGSVAMSSANAGTFGFMAPEQIRNLKLTNASDLYGLGLTLICLIGAIRSTDIGNYIDFSNQLDRSKIDPKLKGCSLTFVKWLDKMVAPDPSRRFIDAKVALKGLQPLYVTRYPSVEISKSSLEFKATSLGEKLTQTITLSNSTPETVLEGRWEVEPHPNDPPHTPDSHAWISFSPKQFKGNRVECQVTVDTRKLFAESIGNRTIILHTNTLQEAHTLTLNIVTAPLPQEAKVSPCFATLTYLTVSILLSYFSMMIIPSLSADQQNGIYKPIVLGLVPLVMSLFGSFGERNPVSIIFAATTVGITGATILTAISSAIGTNPIPIWFVLLVFTITIFLGTIAGKFINYPLNSYLALPNSRKYNNKFLGFLLCIAIICGISLVFSLRLGLLTNPYLFHLLRTKELEISYLILISITFSTLALLVFILTFTLVIPPLEHRRKITEYLRKEEHLIKP